MRPLRSGSAIMLWTLFGLTARKSRSSKDPSLRRRRRASSPLPAVATRFQVVTDKASRCPARPAKQTTPNLGSVAKDGATHDAKMTVMPPQDGKDQLSSRPRRGLVSGFLLARPVVHRLVRNTTGFIFDVS